MTRMTFENTATAGVRKVAVDQRLAKLVDHFVGVNKMVPTSHSGRRSKINPGARESEARIAENVVELLKA